MEKDFQRIILNRYFILPNFVQLRFRTIERKLEKAEQHSFWCRSRII